VPDPLVVNERNPVALVTVMARKGADSAAIGKALGCTPPAGPGRASGDRWTLIGTAPGTWLALGRAPGAGWREALARDLAGLASLSDQSGAYLMFRIAGPKARDLLQRGAFIDLHPAEFGPGSAAVTTIGHVDAILWQSNGLAEFELAVPRSLAASFRHWLDVTAAAL